MRATISAAGVAAGMGLSIFTVILGHTLICMPYAVAILSTAFSSLDKSLEEAAYDLGETKWSAFRLVILPLVMPGIVSALLMSFTISLDEFIIAFFTAGAGRDSITLPMQIFAMIRFGVTPEVNALATLVMGLSLVLLVAAQRANRGLPGA